MPEERSPHIDPVPVLKAWIDLPLEDRVMALAEDGSLLELVRDLVEQLRSTERALHATETKIAGQNLAIGDLVEQLEAFQELAQDASDITQVGHGLELDVPVNLGSVKWVESAHHVLLTMASLASNPASEPEAS